MNFKKMYSLELRDQEGRNIGGLFSQVQSILGILYSFESDPLTKGRTLYNIISEKSKSQSHKYLLSTYKQNRQIKWDTLSFTEKQQKEEEQKVFYYNLNEFNRFLDILQDNVNHIQTYYQEGDYILSYQIHQYKKILQKSCQDVVNIINVIFSQDSDLKLLVVPYNMMKLEDNVVVIYDIMKKEFIDPVNIQVFLDNQYKEKQEVTNPIELLWFKILRGEPSDNIEGVSGIGEKRQSQVIMELRDKLSLNMSESQIKNVFKEYTDNYKQLKKNIPSYILNLEKEVDKIVRNYKLINLQDIDNVKQMISLDSMELVKSSIESYLKQRIKGLQPIYQFDLIKFLQSHNFESLINKVMVNNFIPVSRFTLQCNFENN